MLVGAAVLSHLSVLSLLVGIVVTAVAALRIVCEERLLRDRLPGYAAYAARTKALVLFVV